jgi:hypothetical protein
MRQTAALKVTKSRRLMALSQAENHNLPRQVILQAQPYSITSSARPSVPNRVLNVFVSEVRLQRPRVVASVGECVATGMPQHVRMRL